jgi:hypothetical protein
MPKSPHDALAVLLILASIAVGAYFLKRFRRRLTDEERAVLVARGGDLVAIAAVAGVGIAYFFAPVHPLSAILGACACTALSTYRLGRYHTKQTYSSASRRMLILGLALPSTGFLAAVIVRAMR